MSAASRSRADTVEQGLGDTVGLFEGGKVPVRASEFDCAFERGEIGVALGRTRPVVLDVDRGDGSAYASVERSGGNHVVHVAVDLARHPRIAAATGDPPQLGEVMIRQLAPVDEPAP
jgi:hypothetical protein